MKFLIVAFCGIAIFAGAQAALDAQQIEMFKAMLTECQGKEGASQADIDLMMTGKFPASHESHCVMACINEKLGYLKEGKFVKSAFLDVSKMFHNDDPEKAKIAGEIADECGVQIDGSERCENSFNFQTCLHKAIESRGLPIEFV